MLKDSIDRNKDRIFDLQFVIQKLVSQCALNLPTPIQNIP